MSRMLIACVFLVAPRSFVSAGETPNAVEIIKQMRVFCSGLNSLA